MKQTTNIDRRRLLRLGAGSAVAGLAAQLLPAPSVAAPIVMRRRAELRLAFDADVFQSAARAHAFAGRLASATANRLTIDFVPGNFASLIAGAADAWIGPAGDCVESHPALGYLSGLPCGQALPFDVHRRWLAAEGGAYLQMLAGSMDLHIATVALSDGRSAFYSTEPLDDVSSLAGRQIICRGLSIDVARALGATVDRSNATATDLLDGAVAEDSKLAEIRKFRTSPGLSAGFAHVVLALRKGVRDRLGDSINHTLAAASLPKPRAISETAEVVRRCMHQNLRHDAITVAQAIIADVSSRDTLSRKIAESHRRYADILNPTQLV